MRVTVIDVAKEAGVSRTTVSNVFNGRAKFAPETETAVLAAAKKLGYKPNMAAKELSTHQSHLIGLLLPSYVDPHALTSSPFYNIIIDGVYAALQNVAFYNVMIFTVSREENLAQVNDWIDTRGVDGLIAIGEYEPGFIHELAAKSIPVVLIDNYQANIPDFAYINSDDEAGGYLATQALISRGYQKIALCNFSANSSPLMEKRLAGHRCAMREAGYAEHTLQASGGSAFEAGKKLAEKLFVQGFDAAFCTEDMLAIGVLHGLLRAGVRVGPAFGLIGFDNILIGRQIYPELSTVDQNIFEKGELAARTMLDILTGVTEPKIRTILPVTLIARETTR